MANLYYAHPIAQAAADIVPQATYDTSTPSLMHTSIVPVQSQTGCATFEKTLSIKAFCGSEIRRFHITGESWASLQQEVANVFQRPIRSFVIKYKDEENDFITVSSDLEMKDMLKTCAKLDGESLLKIYIENIVVPEQPPTTNMMPMTSTSTSASSFFAPNWSQQSTYGSTGFYPVSSTPVYSNQVTAPSNNNGSYDNWNGDKARKKELKREVKEKRKREKAQMQLDKSAKKELKRTRKQEKEARKSAKREQKDKARHIKKKQKKSESSSSEDEVSKSVKKTEKQRKKFEKKMQKQQAKAEQKFAKSKPLHARFVKHVTVEDNSDFSSGTQFVKTWRVRNDGTAAWPSDSALIYVSQRTGDHMNSPTAVYLNREVQPGETIDISVTLTAPEAPGFYTGFWRLCGTFEGKMRKFGQQFWCKIHVMSSSDDESKIHASNKYYSVKQEGEMMVDVVTLPTVTSPIQMSTSASSQFVCEQEQQPPTMAMLLRQLKEMGFDDIQRNIEAIRKHNGNLQRIVNELSERSVRS